MENTIEVTNQQKNRPSFDELKTRYSKFLCKLASQVCLEVDEVTNIAYLIYATDDSYDSSKGDYEPRFIFLVRHEVFKEYRSFEVELTDEMESYVKGIEEEELETWRTDETLQNKNLGGDLNKIVQLVLDGHDFEYCAEKLGLTLRRIEQICKQAQEINENQKDLFREVA